MWRERLQEAAGGSGTWVGKVDIMLARWGFHSSNTQKLYKLCKENCKNTYHIETADNLPLENIKGAESVGITRGHTRLDY